MGGFICMARTDERLDFLKPAMPPDTCAELAGQRSGCG